jgi:hypothetical protein
MSLRSMLILSLLSTAVVTGCSKSPAGGDAAPSSSTTAATITGIADCDSFLNAYEQCLADKVPAESRAQMQAGIEQWKSAWKQMAENDATRGTLPGICKQARDATVPALKAYGCGF